MKVFMSWSGQRSKAVAELIANWAKCVVQATQPWISTSGIDRGAVWFSAINDELTNTSVGVICLTHENKNKPWILFEAGALAKGLVDSRVCTFLVDLTPADLESPLSQFNHTSPDREGLWSLTRTLNGSVPVPLETSILEQVFDIHWPPFKKKFDEILVEFPQQTVPEVRTNDSILSEILESSRSVNQRLRALEERNGRAGGGIGSVARTTKLRWAGAGTDAKSSKSFVDGMEIAYGLHQSGTRLLAIEKELLSLGYSFNTVAEIFDTLKIFDGSFDSKSDT